MSEMSVILQHANSSSLIIVDELARSTATEEGIGMCYALCEKLISAKVFDIPVSFNWITWFDVFPGFCLFCNTLPRSLSIGARILMRSKASQIQCYCLDR